MWKAGPKTKLAEPARCRVSEWVVACNVEMGVERLARWAAWQGAKHSDALRHREHLQRSRAVHIASKDTSDFSVAGHKLARGRQRHSARMSLGRVPFTNRPNHVWFRSVAMFFPA
ncbi:hypothetical protein AT984_18015 [Paucibacter sp. KCTC 42545]|nr:hypothetical protein AT984_18015 [Paucibacter sp. KCTC 42545]